MRPSFRETSRSALGWPGRTWTAFRWALALRWAATEDPGTAATRRLRDSNPVPKPLRPGDPVDWSVMTYVQVNDADHRVRPSTLQAMMDGPFKRMLDLCGEDQPVRASARVMEFARGPVARFKDRHAATPEGAQAVDDAVMAVLEQRLAHRGSDGRYLIDVFLGHRTHNG